MEYKNNTDQGIVVSYRSEEPLKPVMWAKFHPGETKELPESASVNAERAGLTEVVKAVESKAGRKKVETKVKKVKKKKK